MTTIQYLALRLLPRSLANSLRTHSELWKIRCCTCHHSQSVWKAGGLRWFAASVGKRKMILCPRCGTLRVAAIEREVSPPAPARA